MAEDRAAVEKLEIWILTYFVQVQIFFAGHTRRLNCTVQPYLFQLSTAHNAHISTPLGQPTPHLFIPLLFVLLL